MTEVGRQATKQFRRHPCPQLLQAAGMPRDLHAEMCALRVLRVADPRYRNSAPRVRCGMFDVFLQLGSGYIVPRSAAASAVRVGALTAPMSSMNRPTPDPSQEGNSASVPDIDSPPPEGLEVGSWPQLASNFWRCSLSMNRLLELVLDRPRSYGDGDQRSALIQQNINALSALRRPRVMAKCFPL